MADPLVAQGTLNRLRGSVIIPAFPQLNVTASYLGEEGITLRLNAPVTTRVNTMTGSVTSPEPYVPVTLTVNLLKTQFLSDLYKNQMELSSLLGPLTVRPDAKTLSPYNLLNTSIDEVGELTFNGKSAGFGVMIGGYYLVNAAIWL